MRRSTTQRRLPRRKHQHSVSNRREKREIHREKSARWGRVPCFSRNGEVGLSAEPRPRFDLNTQKWLGRGLRGNRFHAGWREFETNLPFAGDAATGAFRRGKFPFAGCLQSKIGKKRAWPRVIKFSARHIAGSVHVEPHVDSHR